MEPREKTSVGMTATTLNRLDALKARLRKAGVARADASMASIIEALVAHADFDLLLDKLS